MASGDTLLILAAQAALPPSSGSVATASRRGGTGPFHYAFDAATAEIMDWLCTMPAHYDGGGIDVSLRWAAATAVANDVVWAAAISRHQDDVDDLDTDSLSGQNTVTATAPSASGEKSYDSIAFTDGADMDSVAAGEDFKLRITRLATAGGDTMAGDAELYMIHITEA